MKSNTSSPGYDCCPGYLYLTTCRHIILFRESDGTTLTSHYAIAIWSRERYLSMIVLTCSQDSFTQFVGFALYSYYLIFDIILVFSYFFFLVSGLGSVHYCHRYIHFHTSSQFPDAKIIRGF